MKTYLHYTLILMLFSCDECRKEDCNRITNYFYFNYVNLMGEDLITKRKYDSNDFQVYGSNSENEIIQSDLYLMPSGYNDGVMKIRVEFASTVDAGYIQLFGNSIDTVYFQLKNIDSDCCSHKTEIVGIYMIDPSVEGALAITSKSIIPIYEK